MSSPEQVAQTTMLGRGTASLPATCGELVQGAIEGAPCLVSCPISLWSTAAVETSSTGAVSAPLDSPKAARALQLALAALGRRDAAVSLRLESSIPRGRGYGSSTADIGASLCALAGALGVSLSADDIARLAVAVEPSDSTMFPGLALFDHRQGTFSEILGAPPALSVIVVDPGGEVDTIRFNQRDTGPALRLLSTAHAEAFALLRWGIAHADARAIGQAATQSARAHELILPNPLLGAALDIARSIGAVGICRAHSGTIIGLLLEPKRADAAAASTYVKKVLASVAEIATYDLVGGGARSRAAGAVCQPVITATQGVVT